MSEIHWLNPTSGSFTNAANWSGGVVPGRFDGAILDAPRGAYTVTVAPSPLRGCLENRATGIPW